MNLKAIAISVILCCGSSPIAAETTVVTTNGAHSAASVFRKILRYSVRVRRDDKKNPAVGSGTLVSAHDGSTRVLTCAHVVGNETGALIDLDEDGRSVITLPALVIKVNPSLDLAVLQILIGNTKLSTAPVAKAEPDSYDEMYAIGSPVGVARQSSILRLNTKDATFPGDQGHALWTVSGTIVPGMSGSGVFNDKGEIVAVVKACMVMQLPDKTAQILTSNGFVISLADIKDFLIGV